MDFKTTFNAVEHNCSYQEDLKFLSEKLYKKKFVNCRHSFIPDTLDVSKIYSLLKDESIFTEDHLKLKICCEKWFEDSEFYYKEKYSHN